MRIPLSLRGKLIAAFLLLLVPVLGQVVYSHVREYHQMRGSLLQDQLQTSEAVGTTLEAVLDRGIAVGQTLSLDPMILDFDITAPNRLQSHLARYLALFPEYRNVNVWDANGQLVASAIALGPDEPIPNISDRRHFRTAMASGLPAVSDVLIARVGEEPSIVTASPIRDGAGRIIGLVTVLVDLDQVGQNIRDLSRLKEQAVFVADTEGRLAFHTANPSPSWEERDISSYELVQEVLSQGQFVGSAEGVFTTNQQMVAASRTRSYGWIAAISVSEAVVVGQVQQAALGSLGIYMGIVLLAAMIALGLTYAITSPLGRLTRTMAALARGDLGCRAMVSTGDELESTADSLNRMASSLQREQERLHELVEMGTALSSAESPHQLLELLAQRSTVMLGELTCVCLLDRHGSDCAKFAVHAPDEETRERFSELIIRHHESIFTGIYRSVAETGESILVPRVGEWSLGGDLPRDLARAGARSLIVVPVRGKRGVVGVLTNLSLGQERTLNEEDLSVAEDLANRAGLVIDNALLLRQVQGQQRRAGEAAQEAERRQRELDAVIEGVREGIIVADFQGRMVRVNQRAREILGMQGAPVEGSLLEELGNRFKFEYPGGRSMPVGEWPIARALRGESFVGLETLYHRRDGKDFHLLFSGGSVRDEKGTLQLGVVAFGDITLIRELERAREEFISVVAHDLRSPLTVIIGFASVLRGLAPEQHGQANERKAVESILSSAKRLEKMVADLLDASRIEASRLVLAKESVELPELVEAVVERTVEITKGHPVEVEIRDALPPMEADPSRLEQVLTNLLSNATKYSFPNTAILVVVERVGSEAVVSITNQGQGISPEEQEGVFSRFRRTRAAEATKVPGLGLGLYITKGLVEAHGGRVWVESEAGKYATFRFSLPLGDGAEG